MTCSYSETLRCRFYEERAANYSAFNTDTITVALPPKTRIFVIMAEQRANNTIPVLEVAAFLDYVGALPHGWVLDNLISGGAADGARRGIVSSAMVKEAVAAFTAKASLTKRFNALPPALRFRCAQVYLMGAGGLSLPDLTAYRKEPILQSLLVFAAAQGGPGAGAAKLFGFSEFEPALRQLLTEALLGFGDAGECLSLAHTVADSRRPLSDVAVVCSLAAQGQLTRNSHGGLSRAALNALKHLVRDPTLSGRSASGNVLGHPAGFLIGYCLEEALIVDAEAEYAVNRQAFSAWLNMSVKERLSGINDYVATFLEGIGIDLAKELFKRAEGRWIAVNQILPETDRQAFIRALGVFEFLGRVQTGHSHGGVRFTPCRLADGDVPQTVGTARDTVIMPDFSVIIPQEVSPAELFDFSVIGILSSFDKVYNGRITKESVSNALSAGLDAERLRDWLRKHNAATNVMKTVDEWIREFGRVYVCNGVALASCDETVTRQITALESLRKHLTEVKAHTVFMIKHGNERKVLNMLEKLGFDTRMPGEKAVNTDKKGYGVGRADDVDALADDEREEAAWRDEEADDSQGRHASGGVRRFAPLTDFGVAPETSPQKKTGMNRTKYGSGLKALEPSEMIHVVDYAMLTNQALVIDYDGSAYIKRNIYTVVPLGLDKGIDAAVEAEIPYVRGRKQFYLDKIKRIAVVAQ